MIISVSISAIAILFALIIRFIIFKRIFTKTQAGWLSMTIAVIAIIAEGFVMNFQGEHTAITGFFTMIVCYTILTYCPKLPM